MLIEIMPMGFIGYLMMLSALCMSKIINKRRKTATKWEMRKLI